VTPLNAARAARLSPLSEEIAAVVCWMDTLSGAAIGHSGKLLGAASGRGRRVTGPPQEPPKLFRQTAITIALDVGARYRQDLPCASPAWHQYYAALRNTTKQVPHRLQQITHASLAQSSTWLAAVADDQNRPRRGARRWPRGASLPAVSRAPQAQPGTARPARPALPSAAGDAVHDAVRHGPARGGGAVRHADLGVDVLDVMLGGPCRDEQNSSVAISPDVRPAAARRSTSISRLLKPPHPRRPHQRVRAGRIKAEVRNSGRVLEPHRVDGGSRRRWSSREERNSSVPGWRSGNWRGRL